MEEATTTSEGEGRLASGEFERTSRGGRRSTKLSKTTRTALDELLLEEEEKLSQSQLFARKRRPLASEIKAGHVIKAVQ